MDRDGKARYAPRLGREYVMQVDELKLRVGELGERLAKLRGHL